MMDIYQQKRALRKQIKELKNQFSFDEKKAMSEQIIHQVEQLSEFQNAGCIMAYWSMDDEVHTHPFIQKWSKTKTIILPVVNRSELELKLFRGVGQLVPGENFGIPEPEGALFKSMEQIELIIVPGVAFDKENNRMGRGKAYYDQLLVELQAFKLGLCFHFQYFDQVPHDHLDVKMNRVLFNKK